MGSRAWLLNSHPGAREKGTPWFLVSLLGVTIRPTAGSLLTRLQECIRRVPTSLLMLRWEENSMANCGRIRIPISARLYPRRDSMTCLSIRGTQALLRMMWRVRVSGVLEGL